MEDCIYCGGTHGVGYGTVAGTPIKVCPFAPANSITFMRPSDWTLVPTDTLPPLFPELGSTSANGLPLTPERMESAYSGVVMSRAQFDAYGSLFHRQDDPTQQEASSTPPAPIQVRGGRLEREPPNFDLRPEEE